MYPTTGYTSVENLAALTSEQVVTRELLLQRAAEAPHRLLVRFEDASVWSRAQGLDQACAAAHVLAGLGVERGDRVALLLGNGPAFLRAWWGAAMLGATILPLNPALRGQLLERPLHLGAPKVLVLDETFQPQVAGIELPPGVTLLPADGLQGTNTSVPTLTEPVHLCGLEKLLLTSGTTGPSKLVEVPYLHSYWGYTALLKEYGWGENDVFQIDLPLFHSAALGYVGATLGTGASMSVRARPALNNYWSVAREAGVTGTIAISSMITALLNNPETANETDHTIRLMVTSPIPPDLDAFRARFGVATILTAFGSTETAAPMAGEADSKSDVSFCGRLRPGWELRVVDDYDQEVATGEVGQALVRAARPGVMAPAYFQNPSASGEAWRGGWFHTGDLMRRDERGDYYFAGRSKDVIRRRGENISAYEVELALIEHEAVNEVACVAVPASEGPEDEVKVWVVLADGAEVEMSELLEYCASRLPHHMVPRYYETIDAIPKTPSAKAQKYILRDWGNGGATWDAVAEGYSMTRHGLTKLPSTA